MSTRVPSDLGAMVNRQHAFLTGTSFRCLKGADRENLTRLQTAVKEYAGLIVTSFLNVELIPHLSLMAESFKEKKSFTDPILTEASCLSQLQGGCLGNGCAIIEGCKEFSSFMREIALAASELLVGNQPMEASKAQAWLRRAQQQSESLMKAVNAFEQVPSGIEPLPADEDTALSGRMWLGLFLVH